MVGGNALFFSDGCALDAIKNSLPRHMCPLVFGFFFLQKNCILKLFCIFAKKNYEKVLFFLFLYAQCGGDVPG